MDVLSEHVIHVAPDEEARRVDLLSQREAWTHPRHRLIADLVKLEWAGEGPMVLCATGNRHDACIMGHVIIENDTVSFEFGTCLTTLIAIFRFTLCVFFGLDDWYVFCLCCDTRTALARGPWVDPLGGLAANPPPSPSRHWGQWTPCRDK